MRVFPMIPRQDYFISTPDIAFLPPHGHLQDRAHSSGRAGSQESAQDDPSQAAARAGHSSLWWLWVTTAHPSPSPSPRGLREHCQHSRANPAFLWK